MLRTTRSKFVISATTESFCCKQLPSWSSLPRGDNGMKWIIYWSSVKLWLLVGRDYLWQNPSARRLWNYFPPKVCGFCVLVSTHSYNIMRPSIVESKLISVSIRSYIFFKWNGCVMMNGMLRNFTNLINGINFTTPIWLPPSVILGMKILALPYLHVN